MARPQSLQNILKQADKRVREAAVKALNDAAEEVVSQIKNNMNAQGIHEITGELRESIQYTPATEETPKVLIKSEVFAPKPKKPGVRNPAMKNRYKYGVPYGRIIEFSPRIRKPFFYKAWYEKRKTVKEEVIEKIGNAWSKG